MLEGRMLGKRVGVGCCTGPTGHILKGHDH